MKKIIISVIISLLFFTNIYAFLEENLDGKIIPGMYEMNGYYIGKINKIDIENKYVYLDDYINLGEQSFENYMLGHHIFYFDKVEIVEGNSILNIIRDDIRYALLYLNPYGDSVVLKYISEISCNDSSVNIINGEYNKFPLGNKVKGQEKIEQQFKNCKNLEEFFDGSKKYKLGLENMADYRYFSILFFLIISIFIGLVFFIFYKVKRKNR